MKGDVSVAIKGPITVNKENNFPRMCCEGVLKILTRSLKEFVFYKSHRLEVWIF